MTNQEIEYGDNMKISLSTSSLDFLSEFVNRNQWKHTWHLPKSESGGVAWHDDKSIAVVQDEIRTAKREMQDLRYMTEKVEKWLASQLKYTKTDFIIWQEANYDELSAECAESGADREPDFDFDQFCEDRFESLREGH